MMKIFLCIASVTLLSAAEVVYGPRDDESVQKQSLWPSLVVFVHGSVGVSRKLIGAKTVVALLRGSVDKTDYSRRVSAIRAESNRYRAQAIQKKGLSPIITESTEGARIIEKLYEMYENRVSPSVNRKYYTFGWSGLLSETARTKAARKLYDALKAELKIYTDKGMYPSVTLVGYSHGGSVCLNLADVVREKEDSQLLIEKLILIGMPVHKKNMGLIGCSLFKKIYHLYSTSDSVQALDIFSPHSLISGRCFKGALPTKLVQIELQIRVPRSVPRRGRVISSPCAEIVRETDSFSPGHAELWFLGWTSTNYRKLLPIYPFPLVIYVPLIIDKVDAFLKQIRQVDQAELVTCALVPDQEKLFIEHQEKRSLESCTVTSFVTKEEFERTKAMAETLRGNIS